MKISPGDKVLEIGSGGNPHKKSTILCDKWLFDSSQRGGQKIYLGKPLIVADGEYLPFKNQSFDYSICIHVLEHVEDPARFATELTRVSSKGYIETPSIVWEKMQPFRKHHKWLVFESEKALVFKKNNYYDALFSELIKNIVYGSKSIAILRKSMKKILNVHFEWENSLNIQIEPPNYQHLLDAWIEKKIHTIKNNSACESGYKQDKTYSDFLYNTFKFRSLHKLLKDLIGISIKNVYRKNKRKI